MKYTISYFVNDKSSFLNDVLKPALDSMRVADSSGNYGCFAVSKSDEFARIEKIEQATENSELSDSEKIDEIINILGRINP